MSEIAEKSVIAHSRKAARTYESICLHIQENFQITITRKSVANHFGLASNLDMRTEISNASSCHFAI